MNVVNGFIRDSNMFISCIGRSDTCALNSPFNWISVFVHSVRILHIFWGQLCLFEGAHADVVQLTSLFEADRGETEAIGKGTFADVLNAFRNDDFL